MIKVALAPLATNPDLRNLLKKVAKAAEQTIDIISQDTLLHAGPAQTSVQNHAETAIRDHIASSLSIEPDDFDYAPFSQQGGSGKAHQLFGGKTAGVAGRNKHRAVCLNRGTSNVM